MRFGPLTSSRPFAVEERPFAGLGVHDLRDDARQRVADRAGLEAHLVLAVVVTSGALTATTGDISVQP